MHEVEWIRVIIGTFLPTSASDWYLLLSTPSRDSEAETMYPNIVRQLALVGCVAVMQLADARDLIAQVGARAPQPTPSALERSTYLKAEFALLDGNKDGQVSKAEFQENAQTAIEKAQQVARKLGYETYMASQLYAMNYGSRKNYPEFSQIDRNADGLVSFHKEFLVFPQQTFSDFSRWDADGDGKVTKSEYVKSEKTQREQAGPNEPAIQVPQKRLEGEFVLRDRNEDGSVTWEELLALNDLLPPITYEGTNADASFVMTDTDSNGAISRDEFLANARSSNDKKFLVLSQKVFRVRDLNGDKELSFLEFVKTGENPARNFVAYDKDGDSVIRFDDIKGIQWVDGKNLEKDRAYFTRLDANQDGRVTWSEYRSVSPRSTSFLAIDHLNIDNTISKSEWNAIEKEYRAGQNGKMLPASAASSYATNWFPGIFDLITFGDLDTNKDGVISWKEFRTFPN
jgi:Ca2+-binding EF-hand superfamily protein